MHCGKTGGDQFLDFVLDKAAFGPDCKGHGAASIAGAGSRSGRIGNQGQRSFYEAGQFVLHKGLEQRPEQYLGQNSVAGLLKAADDFLPQARWIQDRAGPVAFLNPESIQEDQPFYAECTDRPDNSSEHLGPWQSEDECHGKSGRRLAFKTNFHFEDGLVKEHDPSRTDTITGQAYAELVPNPAALYLEHVLQTPALEPDAVGAVDKIFFEEKDEVQSRISLKKWRPAKTAALQFLVRNVKYQSSKIKKLSLGYLNLI